MNKLKLTALIGISLFSVIMIPSVLASTVFYGYVNERECFKTKEFTDRIEAEKEYERWKVALGDKFAGFDFNGITEKTITPTSMTVCIFTNK